MVKKGYVDCPQHGKQKVEYATHSHIELSEVYTAKCPICNRRLEIISDNGDI